MVDKKEEYTSKEWELAVKEKLNEFIDNMLSVSKECNMATRYFRPVKESFETHREYDETKVGSAELRIVFNFVEPIDPSTLTFV